MRRGTTCGVKTMFTLLWVVFDLTSYGGFRV